MARVAVRIWILSGPNLGMTGRRQPELYGTQTLAEMEAQLRARFGKRAELEFFQSNHEGDLIDRIEAAHEGVDGIVINPGALTHTSLALHDALAAFPGKKVEVHLTNIAAREEIRRVSLTAAAVDGLVAGFGIASYIMAVGGLLGMLERRQDG